MKWVKIKLIANKMRFCAFNKTEGKSKYAKNYVGFQKKEFFYFKKFLEKKNRKKTLRIRSLPT